MAELEERLAALSPAKRALLERRLLERRAAPGVDRSAARGPAEDEVIRRRAPGEPVPLSYEQELLWSLAQLAPHAIAYNVPRPSELRGRLDAGALQAALDLVVERHQVLRTRIDATEGVPRPRVIGARPVELRRIDLSQLPESRRAQRARAVLEAESRRPFDFARDQLLRAALVALEPEHHFLLLASHHIASDGWSTRVLWQELAEGYAAAVDGRAPRLSELPIQYADYALWQRRWVVGPQGQAALGHWRAALAGAPPELDLGLDHPRPEVQSFCGARRSRLASPDLQQRLRELARRERATLFMVLLAAFGTLLHRRTGEEEMLVGSPIANRNRAELEPLIGYVSNTLLLRLDLSGDPTFRELLARVRGTVLAAFDHAQLPFARLLEELRPERDPRRNPLFQVLFVLQSVPTRPPQLPGLTATRPRTDPGWAKFDLTLSLAERLDGLNATWEHASDILEAATVAALAEQYETLLEAIAADPDTPIGRLGLLGQPGRRQRVNGSGAAPRLAALDGGAAAAGGCVHQLVAERARGAPDAVAVLAGSEQLTYRQLQRRANRLAWHLRELGVGPEELVGVCLGRSLELPVAILAVLKAGGAYLPLDPASPPARLAQVLADARPRLLLTDSHLHPLLPGRPPAVLLDRERQLIARRRTSPPPSGATPANLAYVIYTSGTSGAPKGVEVEHRSVVNHARAVIDRFGLSPSDRVLQFASISFDASVEEIFPTWIAGGTLVLRGESEPISGPAFLRLLGERGVTVLDLPTGYWHEWVAELAPLRDELPAALRLVVIGGEKARLAVYRRWLELTGGRVRLINTYGPTEATVIATAFEPDPAAFAGAELPIGRPIAGVRTLVVDGALHPVPPGVAGELLIAGAGLARGYRRDPARTAERFVALGGGERAYRTGDRARLRLDGQLEFAGRLDRQIKLRGFRIEPEEIEVALGEHPGVAAAAVTLQEGGRGGPRLVAHVVAVDGAPPPAAALRRHLAQRLPAYMVPASFLAVEKLPLNANGKLDRRALAALRPDGGTRDRTPCVAPRDELERRLAALWQEVLGAPRLGVRDDFFELGGNSLLAIRLFARIERELGIALPLATLFWAPSIEALAAELRVPRQAQPRPGAVVEIQGGALHPPLFVAPDLRGDVQFGYRLLASHLAGRPVYGLRAHGLEEGERPHTRIEQMADAHLREIRRLQPCGPYLLAGHCFGGAIACEIAHRLALAGEQVAMLALIDVRPYGHQRGRRRLVHVSHHLRELRCGGPRGAYLLGRARRARTRLARAAWGTFVRRTAGRMSRALPGPADVTEANLRAIAGYSVPVHRGRLTVFTVGRDRARGLAWEPLAGAGVDLHHFEGDDVDHSSIMREPHVHALGAQLAACVEEALVAHLDPGRGGDRQ
jgi:amino acid adenylation domain-containing protein